MTQHHPDEELNVGSLARGLGMQPVDLVRELVADGIEVLPVSERRYRVSSSAYQEWRKRRQQRLAAKFQQGARRADHVRGGAEKPKRRARFTR